MAHSLSPVLHAAAFAEFSPGSTYRPLDVAPDQLAEAIAALRTQGVGGLNVTTPHKEAIIALLDGLDAEAAAIGAVNVVARRKGRLIGFNTDVLAVRTALEWDDLRGSPALVLGAGGAAKAAAHALASAGARVVVANRTRARAEALVASLPAGGLVIGDDTESLAAWLPRCAAVVQATSVGFHDAGAAPLPDGLAFAPGAAALELVYRPLETRFLRQARAGGARVVDGLELLVRQAVGSLALWLERDVPMDVWLPRLRAEAVKSLA